MPAKLTSARVSRVVLNGVLCIKAPEYRLFTAVVTIDYSKNSYIHATLECVCTDLIELKRKCHKLTVLTTANGLARCFARFFYSNASTQQAERAPLKAVGVGLSAFGRLTPNPSTVEVLRPVCRLNAGI